MVMIELKRLIRDLRFAMSASKKSDLKVEVEAEVKQLAIVIEESLSEPLNESLEPFEEYTRRLLLKAHLEAGPFLPRFCKGYRLIIKVIKDNLDKGKNFKKN